MNSQPGHGHPADVAAYPEYARPADVGRLAGRDQMAAAAKCSRTALTGMVDTITAAHPDSTHALSVLVSRVGERGLDDACRYLGSHDVGAVLSTVAGIAAAAVLRTRELERKLADLEADRD